MAAPQISSHNPFRTPAATPDPTGNTESPAISSAAANPPALPARPPLESAVNTTTVPEVDSTGLSEELPPAYTPAADTRHGEATIEYGPRRPYQQPPTHLPPQVRPNHSGPMSTLWSQLTGQTHVPTGSSPWSGYPGHQPLNHSGPSHANQSSSHLQVPIRPSPAASEFARDFYTAGSQPDLAHSAPASPRSYSPPPGPPPTSSTSSDHGDRQPTSVPKPGHPLLRDGRILVYPKGYDCPKCMNIGYKRMDPSHPCKRCWSKFAKPFQGPLVTAYTTQSSSSSTFQRPLPTFHPPQRTTTSAPRPQSFPPPAPASYVSPPRDPNIQVQALSLYGPPPPRNAVVYRAGDPRIGGRLCWRCEGTGSISLFLFDSTTCFDCGGVGRIFR